MTKKRNIFGCSGFLTLPTAYVTGNPVECVVHPTLWNKENCHRATSPYQSCIPAYQQSSEVPLLLAIQRKCMRNMFVFGWLFGSDQFVGPARDWTGGHSGTGDPYHSQSHWETAVKATITSLPAMLMCGCRVWRTSTWRRTTALPSTLWARQRHWAVVLSIVAISEDSSPYNAVITFSNSTCKV